MAPSPNPVAMHMKRYANSSGSLIGVLNLTIESAPTSPKDKAKEDFTTEIIRTVVKSINGKILIESLVIMELDQY